MVHCMNCNLPIEYVHVIGKEWQWLHPDLCDVDSHGTQCNNEDGDVAEPFKETIRVEEIETYV
jgi:hypothetical protein